MRSMRYLYMMSLIVTAVLLCVQTVSAQANRFERPVTVNVENATIQAAMEEIFRGSGVMHIIQPGVEGRVTLHLVDTPLRDAFAALVKAADVTGYIDGGVCIVAPKPKPVKAIGPASSDGGPNVRVGLVSKIGRQPSLIVSCSNSFDIVNVNDRRVLYTASNEQIILSARIGGIAITRMGVSLGTFAGPIRLEPSDRWAAFEIVSPKLTRARYGGILEISGGQGLAVVNELPLEDYVRGVIPAEVPAAFHLEAQKALAVAIRTYAAKSLTRHRTEGYNLCDSIHCQGFAGDSKDAPWVDAIAEETRGQVATHNGELIHAVYSSDCGGITQSNEDAGMGNGPWPYLRSVVDNPGGQRSASIGDAENQGRGDGENKGEPNVGHPLSNAQHPEPLESLTPGSPDPSARPQSDDYCAGGPYHSWSISYTPEQLGKIFFRAKSTEEQIGKFQSMEFAEYDCSGRVKVAIVKGDKGEVRMSGTRLRELFGVNVMKSTRMSMSISSEGKYIIEGKGHGHGVGLCSFGANGLAKSREGITYIDILKHYYTGIETTTRQDAK